MELHSLVFLAQNELEEKNVDHAHKIDNPIYNNASKWADQQVHADSWYVRIHEAGSYVQRIHTHDHEEEAAQAAALAEWMRRVGKAPRVVRDHGETGENEVGEKCATEDKNCLKQVLHQESETQPDTVYDDTRTPPSSQEVSYESLECGHDGDLVAAGTRSMGLDQKWLSSFLSQKTNHVPTEIDGTRTEGSHDDAPMTHSAHANHQSVSQSNEVRKYETCAQSNPIFEFQSLEEVDENGESQIVGLEVMSVNLIEAAQVIGASRDLVVIIPAYIEGIPVRRVTYRAFHQARVHGVGVACLVLPHTLEKLDTGALKYLSVQHIYVGKSMRDMGDLSVDFMAQSPNIAQRRFDVSPENPLFVAREGSLFARVERTAHELRLEYAAVPYPQTFELGEDVTQIAAGFASQGCDLPERVVFGSALDRVMSRAWDHPVWSGSLKAPAVSVLRRRGVRFARENAVRVGECWYDIIDNEAHLIAGPGAPTSVSRTFAQVAAARVSHLGTGLQVSSNGQEVNAQVALNPREVAKAAAHKQADARGLVVPATVEGCPVVRVAPYAITHVPGALVLPDTITHIDHHNKALGATHLSLPRNLRWIGAHSFCSRTFEGVVHIPASVVGIGSGSFEYARCQFDATGTVVHTSADQLMSCFIGETDEEAALDASWDVDWSQRQTERHVALKKDVGYQFAIPFDFDRYDELLRSGRTIPDREGALLLRLIGQPAPDDAMQAYLREALTQDMQSLATRVAVMGVVSQVKACIERGLITRDTQPLFLEALRRANRADCVLFLVQAFQEPTKKASARERFSL